METSKVPDSSPSHQNEVEGFVVPEKQPDVIPQLDSIPPESFPTLNSMLEHGLMLSREAIITLFPELSDNLDALEQAESYLAYHLKEDVQYGFGNKRETNETEQAIKSVIEELIASGIIDLPENELFELVSERLDIPVIVVENYFPLHRRYGDHS